MTEKELLRQRRLEAKLRKLEIRKKVAKNHFKTGSVYLSSSYEANQRKYKKNVDIYCEVQDLNARKKIAA